MPVIRHDWTLPEVRALHDQPPLEGVYRAPTVRREVSAAQKAHWWPLLSVTTGGCPEDCAYCPQAGRSTTGVKAEKRMEPAAVVESARQAKAAGATRFCMGAAWR